VTIITKKFFEEENNENKENIPTNLVEKKEAEPLPVDKVSCNKSNLTPAKTPAKKSRPANPDQHRHQPTLSKVSMTIASTLGDPFERLTSKSKSIRKKNKPVATDSLTFTPKINSRSTILMQNKKDRGVDRFQELHEQAYYLESKKEKLRIEKDLAATAEETQNCAFKPQLVSNYSPEYLSEMNFVERSYLWKKRIEQKLDNQRKIKSEAEPAMESGPLVMTSRAFQPKIGAMPLQNKILSATHTTVEELNEFFNLVDEPSRDHQDSLDRYLY
jgi:hypothetical protein